MTPTREWPFPRSTMAVVTGSPLSEKTKRVYGAVMGMMIADSLAMPVHWYYTPGTIERDFGEDGIQFYEKPLHPHPDAFAWSMTYEGSIDIYHGVEKHIRKTKPPPEENVHYHHGLEAGDVTLSMQLARVLMSCLDKNGKEQKDWAQEFVNFFKTTSPALQNDVYRDVFIRRFFERLSEGRPLHECPVPQYECWSVGSMGGLIPAVLVALTFVTNGEGEKEEMMKRAIEIHCKTHQSENVTESARILCPLIVDLCAIQTEETTSYNGDPAEVDLGNSEDSVDPRRLLILEAARKIRLPAVTGPSLLRRYNKARGPGNIPKDEMYNLHTSGRENCVFDPSLLMDVPDENVIGRKGFLGTVCYTEHGVPAILYLAYKYFDEPVHALLRNANLLGDSTSRGALLGAILGAAHGTQFWPDRFVQGLRESDAIQQETREFATRVT